MSVPDSGAEPRPQDEYCGYCGTRIPPLGRFCPRCGALRASLREGPPGPQHVRPAPVRRTPSWRLIIKTLLAFGMLTFAAQLVLGLAALIWGTTIVLPEIVHDDYIVFVIAPVLIGIAEISGDALAAYYLLIVAAIVASAIWLALTSAKGYYKELKMKGEPRKHSAFFDLCGLMFAVLFMNVVVVLVTGALWEEPTSPTEDSELWRLLFLLANASVWEELVVRVLLIGVPLLLIDLLRNKMQDKRYRYVLGGGFTFGVAEVSLVLVSSALFGLGHLDGWGSWKVFPAAVAGVAFGYMFLRHGLASAIMLHFAFDYLSMPTEVFASTSDMGMLIIFGFAVLAWMAMGAVFFGYYILRMVEFVTKREYFEEAVVARTYPPYQVYYTHPYVVHQVRQPPPGPAEYEQRGAQQARAGPAGPQASPGFFVCPVCGSTGASWRGGKFQCLRCGTVI